MQNVSFNSLVDANTDLLAALKALSFSIFAPGDDRSPELSTALEMTVSAITKAENLIGQMHLLNTTERR